ncbi:SCO7613 C-terminal domain-containing membrane protein [Blastococcus sp. SYSU DS0973]
MTPGTRPTQPAAPPSVPPFPYAARPPQVLLTVGAVLLVSAGATLASAYGGPLVRGALLVLAVAAAAGSVRADRAGLRSSAETFAASAAGLALAASDIGGALRTGDPLLPLALTGVFLAVARLSPATAAWPLAAWAGLQVTVLRVLGSVPELLRTEFVLAVALVGLAVALFGRPLVARVVMATTAPWFAAGVLAGSAEAWTAGAGVRWLAAALMAGAAGGLLLARLREPLDVLLGPPRLVPVVCGAVTGVAVAGASSAGGPVAVAVAGFAGVLVAAVAAGELSGWRRGLFLPVALSGGVLLAASSIGRLVAGAHWSALALLLLLTAAPTVWVAALRPDDRPVAAPTAVGCLAGAALLGLPDGWASPAGAAVLLTVLYVASLGTAAALERDSRRATVLAAAAVAALAVLLLVAEGDRGQVLVHLTVQGAATLAWAGWTGRAARRDAGTEDDASAAWRVGAAQLVLAAWIAAALGGTATVEAYTLPAAAGLLLAAGRGLVREASWPSWGPGLVTAAAPSTALAVLSPDAPRGVLVLAVAAVAMVAGARAGIRAPLLVGALSTLVLALGLAVRALPWPVGTALVVGTALLLIGMRRERAPVAGFAARLADLR